VSSCFLFTKFSRSARLELSDDNLAVYDGLMSLTFRGVTPETTERRPLSSEILATDVYPVHYRRYRRDDDESGSQRRARRWLRSASRGKFSSRVSCHWETSCRQKACINHEARIRGIRQPRRRARPESDSQSFIIHRNEKRPGAFRGQIFDTVATQRSTIAAGVSCRKRFEGNVNLE